MAVRGKFYVSEIRKFSWGTGTRVILTAVTGDAKESVPEDLRYHQFTPSGTIEIWVDNPPAEKQFVLGKSFYVDFTPADAPVV